jgi:hypothetical protein
MDPKWMSNTKTDWPNDRDSDRIALQITDWRRLLEVQ